MKLFRAFFQFIIDIMLNIIETCGHFISFCYRASRIVFASGLLLAPFSTGDRGKENPTQDHENCVHRYTKEREEESTYGDGVVVVDPAVSPTAAFLLPVNAAGVKDNTVEEWTGYGAKSTPHQGLHAKCQRPLLFSHCPERETTRA